MRQAPFDGLLFVRFFFEPLMMIERNLIKNLLSWDAEIVDIFLGASSFVGYSKERSFVAL